MNCFCSYNIWLFWFGWYSIPDAPTRTAFYVESSSCLFKCIDRSFGPSRTLSNTCAIVVNANDCGTRSKGTTQINAAAESNDRVNLAQPSKGLFTELRSRLTTKILIRPYSVGECYNLQSHTTEVSSLEVYQKCNRRPHTIIKWKLKYLQFAWEIYPKMISIFSRMFSLSNTRLERTYSN